MKVEFLLLYWMGYNVSLTLSFSKVTFPSYKLHRTFHNDSNLFNPNTELLTYVHTVKPELRTPKVAFSLLLTPCGWFAFTSGDFYILGDLRCKGEGNITSQAKCHNPFIAMSLSMDKRNQPNGWPWNNHHLFCPRARHPYYWPGLGFIMGGLWDVVVCSGIGPYITLRNSRRNKPAPS